MNDSSKSEPTEPCTSLPGETVVAPEKDIRDFIVSDEINGMRIDQFLAEQFSELSRMKIRKVIAAGAVSVNGKVVKPSFKLFPNQKIQFEVLPNLYENEQKGEDIPLDVLFEDEHIVAVNKPAAMVVHPAKGHWKGTLTSALIHRFASLSSIGGATRPGIVHRLDRDTSGVILVAKTDVAHMSLVEQFQNRTVKKQYWAIVGPAPDLDSDVITVPIGKHPYHRERMAVRIDHASSKPAETRFQVNERFSGFAAVDVFPKTGRTHQIRVHMTHIGFPILCDRLYSNRGQLTRSMFKSLRESSQEGSPGDVLLDRQALHAKWIQIDHPVSGKRMEFSAPLAEDLLKTLDVLREVSS